MTENTEITIYRYDRLADGFWEFYKTNAWAHKISSVLTGERGRNRASSVKIRIPKLPDMPAIPAQVGDYVYIGKTEERIADKPNCFKIYEVAENLYGANPHYKILAY